MANGSVSRGAARQVIERRSGVIGAAQIPQVHFSTGGAEIFERLASDSLKLQNQFHNQLDQQAAAEGERAGANAGQAGTFEMQDFGTIRGRAYNKAASDAYVHTLEAKSNRAVNDLFERHRNDPQALQKSIDAYAEGAAGELNDLNPMYAAAYKHRMSTRNDAMVARAKEVRFAEVKDQAQAAELENSVALNREIDTLSDGLFSKNPEVSATSAAGLQQLTADYMAIYNQKDENGRPLFSAKDRAEAGIRLQNKVTRRAVSAWFSEQEDKAAAYAQIVAGKFQIKTNRPNVPGGNVGTVYERLVAKGWTPAQAAGIVGNLQQESGPGLSLKAVGDGGTAFGIAQWRHERLTNLQRFAKANKMDWRSVEAQADFIDFELKTSERQVGEALKNAKTADEAAHAFISFERPAGWTPQNPAGGHGYRNRVRNAMRLANGIGKGKLSTVDLLAQLPESERKAVEADMRQQISFQNQQEDRAEREAEKNHGKAQDHTAFATLARVAGAGTKDPDTGETFQPPSLTELRAMVRRDELSPKHGEQLIRAITTPRPEMSDAGLKKMLIMQVNNGQDIAGDILANMNKLSAADVQQLYALNRSINRAGGDVLSSRGKQFLTILNGRINTRSLMEAVNDDRQERVAAAKMEYIQRVEEGEDPAAVASDLMERATVEKISKLDSRLQSLVRPRFFAPATDGRMGIDVLKTNQQLQAARKAGQISEASLLRQARLLKRWHDIQQEIAAAKEARK